MVLGLIDTGASVSLISESLIDNKSIDIKEYKKVVNDASGNTIPIIGKSKFYINTPQGRMRENLLIHRDIPGMKVGILLGMNILQRSKIDLRRKIISFENEETETEKGFPVLNIVSNTIVNNDEEFNLKGLFEENMGKGQRMKRSAGQMEDKSELEPDQLEDNSISRPFKLHLLEDLSLPPNNLTIRKIKVNEKYNSKLLMMENAETKQGIVTPNMVSRVENGEIIINMVNIRDEEVKLPQGTGICNTRIIEEEELCKEKINHIYAGEEKKLQPLSLSEINCENERMKPRVLALLNKYRRICWMEGEQLGRYKGDKLRITLTTNKVINKPPYRIPHAKEIKLEEKMKELEKDGVIARSKSSYNSPLICVKKGETDFRPCIDYREINRYLEPVHFPIPRIDDLLNSLGEARIISSLDLASAYHQCEIDPRDTHKTAFTFKGSKWEYKTIPFGLSSAPGFFSRIINETLSHLIGPQVICYLDDILIISRNEEEHLERIRQVLMRLEEANIKLKIVKCFFFTEEVKFLGYKISKYGMKMDKGRVAAIKEMEYPKNKKGLQAFLGAINYYRMFIENLGDIADPLYELLRKNAKYIWSERQSEAVDTLKQKLVEAPILVYPDFSKKFIIHTDASLKGIGAVLMQVHDETLKPISYVSKCLNEAQRKYSATKREALALIFGLEQFRHLILCYETHVFTDHLPLLGILTKETKDACINRWTLLVQEYKIKLHHIPGKDNLVADVLSRLTKETKGRKIEEDFNKKLIERINHLETEKYSFIPEKMPFSEEELREAQKIDEECKGIKEKLRGEGTKNSGIVKFKIIKNIVFVHRTIKRGEGKDELLVPYIPKALMKRAFHVIHEAMTAGHQGQERTIKLFKKNFFNYNENKIIKKYCEQCESCIKAKTSPDLVPIKKYPIPLRPFHTVSADLLGPLPITSLGNKFILVIRDYTTRYSTLTALENKEADSVIQGFRNMFANYGPSLVCVTDNGTEFVNEKFREFLTFFNTRKVEISPYHPESQGLAERLNRDINKLIRIYSNDLNIEWDIVLPTLQLTINNTFNSSIGDTPFYALYGHDSPTVTFSQPKLSYSESDLTYHLKNVAQIREHCRAEILKSQGNYTEYTNRGRKEKDIKIGQRVFARLKKHFTHTKLDYPISGPMIVTDRKGNAFVLKNIATEEVFTVHPDEIIVKNWEGNLQPIEGTELDEAQGKDENKGNRRSKRNKPDK